MTERTRPKGPKAQDADYLDALDSSAFLLDTDATATPTASKIPIAEGSGTLAAGWLPTVTKAMVSDTGTWGASEIPDISATYIATSTKGAASGVASLNGSTKVVEDPANATATPTASKIPIADGSGKLAAGWGGSASTLATLGTDVRVTPAQYPRLPTLKKTAAYTVVGGEGIIYGDPAGGAFDITLPVPAASFAGERITVCRYTAAGNALRVVISGGGAFLGGESAVELATLGDTVDVYCIFESGVIEKWVIA